MALKALIFDFDGLMVDTEQSIFNAYCKIFAEHGAELPLSTWEGIIGSTGHRDRIFLDLEQQIGHPVDRDHLRERARQEHHGISSQLPAIDGVATQIADAQRLGLGLGVASSSTLAWVHGHLQRLGLIQHFGTLCTREDVVEVKPNPEIYALAASRLGVEPQEAVALEDSPIGVASAKAAGLFCVAIPNPLTASMSLDAADMHVPTLAELSLDDIAKRIGG
jgi:HAD superfamily hydrolase (TIGR01509 family)